MYAHVFSNRTISLPILGLQHLGGLQECPVPHRKKRSDDGGTHHLRALENIASPAASVVYGSKKNQQQLLVEVGRQGG
jgi:hypothetical protein